MMLSWALYCLIVPQTLLTVRFFWRLAQKPHWVEDIGVTNASSEQDILHLPTCPPNAGVSGNMDYSRYKREPVHHRGEFQQCWVIWCSSSSSTYGPGPAQTSTPRQPSGIQIPADYLFQTLRYVQRSNNQPLFLRPLRLLLRSPWGWTERAIHACWEQ